MGEEVKLSEYETNDNGDDERVPEWEMGLPSADDLTPLSQPLIPRELASAFSISPAPYRTLLDVNRESQTTISNLRGGACQLNAMSSSNFKSFNNADRTAAHGGDPMVVVVEEEAEEDGDDREGSGSESRNKVRKIGAVESEEADSAAKTAAADDEAARTLKRPRLVWTPQLHKRFVDVVAHLGIKNAVPKTIMQLMNVEGLTRENVASHLQKYRLYLKRMQGGLSSEGPSSSDHQLFASAPVPQSLHEGGGSGVSGGGGGVGGGSVNGNGHMGMPIPLPYHPMMPVPVYGVQTGNNSSNHSNNNHYHHHYPQFNYNHHHHNHNGFDGNGNGSVGLPYNVLQQRDWSGNNYGSVLSYPTHHHPPHVAPSDNM